jgi:hypothetical protein
MRQFFFITLLAIATATCALAHDIGYPFSILMPGNFQDADLDEFNFPERGWLALVVRDGHWELTPATVSIENQVVTSNHSKALALLHERSLVAGRVETPNMKFSGERKSLSISSPGTIKIAYKGAEYRVTMNKSGTIVLQTGESTTILDRNREDADLMWAGDLDKDGKLDLILESGTDKNATYCLYLSGMAGEKALVKRIGCQFHSG